MMALARFDLVTAVAMNPLVAAVGIAGMAYIVHALGVALRGWRPWRPQARTPGGRRALRAAAIAALGLNWAYLIAVGR